MKNKRLWIYAGIILIFVLGYILISGMDKSGVNTNNNLPSNQNQNSIQPSQNNSITKNNYSAIYPLDWEKLYLDRPNDLASVYIQGNYDTITISAQTQVSKITITGAHNNVILCNGNYPTPEISNIGVFNVVNNTAC